MNWFLIVIIILIVLLLIWFLISKSNKPKVDWTKYLGTWYEIARLPTPFENGCTNAVAQYTMNADGTINVKNQCEINGQTVKANGTARIVGPNKLAVKFENSPVEGDYTVFYVDPNYQTALVGSNNKQNLWILSRNQTVDPNIYPKLIELGKKLGYDTSKLIINK